MLHALYIHVTFNLVVCLFSCIAGGPICSYSTCGRAPFPSTPSYATNISMLVSLYQKTSTYLTGSLLLLLLLLILFSLSLSLTKYCDISRKRNINGLHCCVLIMKTILVCVFVCVRKCVCLWTSFRPNGLQMVSEYWLFCLYTVTHAFYHLNYFWPVYI